MRKFKSFYKRAFPAVVGSSIMVASSIAAAAGETTEGGIDQEAVVALIKAAGVTVGVVGVACMGVYLALKGFQWARSAIK